MIIEGRSIESNTIKMHSSVLYRLTQALAADFATEEAWRQKKIAFDNMTDDQLDRYQNDYDQDVDLLVDNMSKVLGSPNDVRRLFRNAGIGLQLSLLMRHEFICFELQNQFKNDVFIVPKQIDELFKLLFIDGHRSLQPFLKR